MKTIHYDLINVLETGKNYKIILIHIFIDLHKMIFGDQLLASADLIRIAEF